MYIEIIEAEDRVIIWDVVGYLDGIHLSIDEYKKLLTITPVYND